MMGDPTIQKIKEYRARHGCSLREAHDAIMNNVEYVPNVTLGSVGDGAIGDTSEITRLRAENKKLREALRSVIAACDEGRMVQRRGVTGQTIEAQIRASVYNGVAALPVEEARKALEEK
jgi:hypothetical protein